ncbi:enoyl-CoA hydratase/isomerase family protein [Chloroflexota bacterium]
MNYKVLEFEQRGAIALLTLNRPERLNALSLELLGELGDALDRLMDDIKTRVVIIQGKGRAFCSGLDLNLYNAVISEEHELGKAQYIYRELQQVFSGTILKIRRIPQPVITAVAGPATGAGWSLAMASDVCIAGESARFNAAFIKVGFSACDCGSSYFLPRLIGRARAAEYLLTGRFMNAVTAERFGLVSRIVPDAQVETTALELAEEMLATSPFGLRMTKEVFNQNIDAPSLEIAIQLEDRTQTLCILTEDAKEGPKAFLEKRAPIWRDR